MPAIQEYKKAVQFSIKNKKKEVAVPGDILVFITTSSVPSFMGEWGL